MITGKKKKRWLGLLGILLVLLVGGYVVLNSIYRLPDISKRTQSYRIDDGQTTRMGRLFEGQLSSNPGKSGVFLLSRENMHWTGGQGGPDTVFEKEPYATTMQKLTVGILKWLPIDSQL